MNRLGELRESKNKGEERVVVDRQLYTERYSASVHRQEARYKHYDTVLRQLLFARIFIWNRDETLIVCANDQLAHIINVFTCSNNR